MDIIIALAVIAAFVVVGVFISRSNPAEKALEVLDKSAEPNKESLPAKAEKTTTPKTKAPAKPKTTTAKKPATRTTQTKKPAVAAKTTRAKKTNTTK